MLTVMSRPMRRVRPTRDETRTRIFEATARVIEEVGVSGATIDQIVNEAGFTRGAFYSNFDNKDDLLVSMLQDHLAQTKVRNAHRLQENSDAASLVASLQRDDDYEGDPLHRSPVLQIELILHVARRDELRPLLADRLAEMRTLVGEIANAALKAAGVETSVTTEELGFMLVALEDGLRLHHLLDPSSTPDDSFTTVLSRLIDLIEKKR